ncbi:MAG: DNA recombination protein RmuC [Acidimicrobiales bacterium]
MAVGLIVGLVAGAVTGLVFGLLVSAHRHASTAAETLATKARLTDAQAAVADLANQLDASRASLSDARAEQARQAAELDHARQAAEQRAATWEEDRRRLAGSFAELSGKALEQNSERFLALADQRLRQAQETAAGDLVQRQQAIAQLLEPFRATLTKYEEGLQRLEVDRQGAYRELTTRVAQLGQSQAQLERETRHLVTALRSPQTRGRWGEIQLRRVVEMAGMLPHCDFDEQVRTGEDGRLRPDMVVHVPGGGEIVVDAKVPLEAYLRAVETDDDDERKAHLVAHARQLRDHVDQMTKREYWRHVGGSAEQVVVFVPGDSLLSAAYEHDATLQEHAMANGVLLTTPTMLIALLRTVAYGWRQELLADNARQVQKLGAELYDRLRTMGGHLTRLQRSITGTVEAFNQTVGSLEARVLVTARKFPEMGAGLDAEELAAVGPVEASPRLLQAAELTSPHADDAMVLSPARPTAVPRTLGLAGGADPDDDVADARPGSPERADDRPGGAGATAS